MNRWETFSDEELEYLEYELDAVYYPGDIGSKMVEEVRAEITRRKPEVPA